MLPLYCLFPCLSNVYSAIIQFAVFLFKVNYDIVISFSRFSLYITDVLFRVNSVPKCPFISKAVAPATIFKILGAKVCIAIISGFLAELVYVNVFKKKEKDMDIHVVCEEEHCSCEDGVLKSALKHTLKIFVYILLITFILTLVIEMIGEDHLAVVFQNIPVVGEMIAALVGLIPNCASSVVITELYLSGIIGAGAMMSGLLVNAGVGLLVLFRLNRNWKQNAGIMAALYGFGVVWGVIIELLGIVF